LDPSRDTGVPQSAVAAPSGSGRALVPLSLPATAGPHRAFRPDARFVTHLIATASLAPQTRSLGRAAPEHVAMAYGGPSAPGLPAPARGLALSLIA
jgi:hypothetical protein